MAQLGWKQPDTYTADWNDRYTISAATSTMSADSRMASRLPSRRRAYGVHWRRSSPMPTPPIGRHRSAISEATSAMPVGSTMRLR